MIKGIDFILMAVFCNVFAQISMKKAAQFNLFDSNMIPKTIFKILGNPFVWLGIILYFISFILGLKIYERFDLSIVSPAMMGLIFIILLFASNILFEESLSIRKFLGVFIITVGIFIIAKK